MGGILIQIDGMIERKDWREDAISLEDLIYRIKFLSSLPQPMRGSRALPPSLTGSSPKLYFFTT